MTSGESAPGARANGDSLPRWDLTTIFPSVASPEFEAGFASFAAITRELVALFDREQIGKPDQPVAIEILVPRFETVLNARNAVDDAYETLDAWLSCQVDADSRDEAAEAAASTLQAVSVDLVKLGLRWNAWIGSLDVEELIARSVLARDHAYALRQAAAAAKHLMSPAEEALAAELATSGASAWEKLYDMAASRVTATIETKDGLREEPITVIRALATDPDRATRQNAYEAELRAWEGDAVPLAAAMNGIKGSALTLFNRRGWQTPLDESIVYNAIDRETLDAMIGASRDAFPVLRRYLQTKATALGLEQLAWFDLFAPVGDPGREWTWPEATDFVTDQFAQFSGRMADLMRRAVAEQWIDVGPREGKSGGAYCAWLRDGDSRILMNFTPTYDSVQTLAHEMGHAYHNLNLRGLTPLQRVLPMTLAETASTFCETIVREAALAHADDPTRLFIIEQSLQGSCQIVVDILSRFDFETAVFNARADRDLTESELCEAMLAAQRATYGDGLDPERLHAYMWAAKSHYYIPSEHYYNYPYLFGLLFGLGLYARYLEDPKSFPARYDQLLAGTGRANAYDLAAEWGIDLHERAFWESSLAVIAKDVDRFAELVDSTGAGR